MIGKRLLIFGMLLGFALPVFAQDKTLAELRTNLDGLRNELQQLRSELVEAGPEAYRAAGGDDAIDRMNAMERKLSELTNQTEQLHYRIARIVGDSTRRIGDIEFRLCEMDESCDLGALTTIQLGNFAANTVAPPNPDISYQPQRVGGLAASAAEQSDFNAAIEVLDQGDFARAAAMFGEVAANHAGGPLTAEALYLRGSALENAGEYKMAAVAWLEGFTAEPNGPRAAQSLLGLADAIASQDDPTAPCLYLAEVPVRFPGSPQAAEAEGRMRALNCQADNTVEPQADMGAGGGGNIQE